jgi:predicted 2-oxoglutarate/Fe(II)-dependent dioxygenase YbiX
MNPFDHIIIQPNVIPEYHINELMKLTNQETSYATVGSSDDQDVEHTTRKTLWYPIPHEVLLNLNSAVMSCYEQFMHKKFNSKVKNIEPVQFLGYPVGGHYIEHNDSETFEDGEWKRISPRDISILYYLNEDYMGGELEFTQLGLTIKPKKGMMVAFPSYHQFAHKVHPVKYGFRYSLVSWLETEKRLYDTIRRDGF